MRRSNGEASELPYWKSFPIGPILVSYGGDDPPSGYGERPYRCPFHGDSNASATVYTVEGEEQWFNCHAMDCPTGNAVQVIMKADNVEYQEALARAEETSGTSNTSVRETSGRSDRRSGGSRSGSGVRSFKRTRGSGRPDPRP